VRFSRYQRAADLVVAKVSLQIIQLTKSVVRIYTEWGGQV